MKIGSVIQNSHSFFIQFKRGYWKLLKVTGALGSTYSDEDLNDQGESVHVLDADLGSLDSQEDYAALYRQASSIVQKAPDVDLGARNALLYAMYGQPEAEVKKKAPQIRKHTPAPPEVLAMVKDLEANRSVNPLTLSQIAIRNVKAIYKNGAPWEDGFSFSTEPGALKTRRSIGLDKKDLLRLLNGETLSLTFGKMGTADYWADWSEIEKNKKAAEIRAKSNQVVVDKKQQEQQLDAAASSIPDSDPDLATYAKILFDGQDPEDYVETLDQITRSSRHMGKRIIYAVRTKDPISKDFILEYIGWTENKRSRKFFKHLTGITLPSTEKGSAALLNEWYTQ
jgi:hypothetical protein